MLNAGSIPGRIIPNVIAQKLGYLNVLTFVVFVCGALVFAMIGLKTVGGVVVFSLFYGFFSGACEYKYPRIGQMTDFVTLQSSQC